RNSAIEAFVILLASSAGQRAWEYEKEKMAFFTWAIVQAMACEGEGGEACNEKGELTLGRLIGVLQEKIPAKVREAIGKEQKPKVEISDSYKADDLVLSAAPRLAGSKAVAGAPAIISRELPELEEPRNWGYAERGNTPGDYRYYLRLFPNGPHADEARIQLAKLDEEFWRLSKDQGRYADYLKEFPQGAHAAEANNFLAAEIRKQKEEADWQSAKRENTQVTYRHYISAYPDGKYVPEARIALANLERIEEARREDDAWRQAVSNNSIAGYQAYLNVYPQGRYQADARRTMDELRALEDERRENAVWDLAKNSSGLTAYEAYLKDFPSGRYANEARAVIGAIKQCEEQARRRAVEDAAWEKAKGNGALQSYQEYLTAYPQGRYIESASAAIGAIRLAEAEKRRIEEEDAAWERAKSGASK